MSTAEENATNLAILKTKQVEHDQRCKEINEANIRKFDLIFSMLRDMQKHIYMGMGILVALQFAAVVFIKFVD